MSEFVARASDSLPERMHFNWLGGNRACRLRPFEAAAASCYRSLCCYRASLARRELKSKRPCSPSRAIRRAMNINILAAGWERKIRHQSRVEKLRELPKVKEGKLLDDMEDERVAGLKTKSESDGLTDGS